jgi:hypothetical protein
MQISLQCTRTCIRADQCNAMHSLDSTVDENVEDHQGEEGAEGQRYHGEHSRELQKKKGSSHETNPEMQSHIFSNFLSTERCFSPLLQLSVSGY